MALSNSCGSIELSEDIAGRYFGAVRRERSQSELAALSGDLRGLYGVTMDGFDGAGSADLFRGRRLGGFSRRGIDGGSMRLLHEVPSTS